MISNFPFRRRNIKKEEFYSRKYAQQIDKKLKRRPLTAKDLLTITVYLTSFILLSISVYVTSMRQETRTSAQVYSVKLLLYPNDIETEKGSKFTLTPILVNQNRKKIASIILAINFDKSVVKLTGIDSQTLSRQFSNLKYTPMAKANTQGMLKIFVGSESIEGAPTDTVNLPQLVFSSVEDSPGYISFNPDQMQVVFQNQELASIELEDPVQIHPKQ